MSFSIYNLLVGQESGFVVCNSRQMFVMPVQSPRSLANDGARSVFAFNVIINTSRES
jgi:hypothetical protein